MYAVKLRSMLFELLGRHEATISVTTGHLAQALFLNLVKQFDPAQLSANATVQVKRPKGNDDVLIHVLTTRMRKLYFWVTRDRTAVVACSYLVTYFCASKRS